MRLFFIILVFFYINLFAENVDKIIKDRQQEEQQRKIFEEQQKNSEIKINKNFENKKLEIDEDISETNCFQVKKININNTTVFEEKDFEVEISHQSFHSFHK